MEPNNNDNNRVDLDLQNATQVVKFLGDDENHTEVLRCQNVTLIPSAGDHQRCSPFISIINKVDFSWEHKYYTGQLLSIHINGLYLAYGLKAFGQNNATFVRVVNGETNCRTLLKGMQGAVQDLAFAHLNDEIILAVVDEYGSLFVFKITEGAEGLEDELLLHVNHRTQPQDGCNHRVIWVPFVCEEEEEEDEEEEENVPVVPPLDDPHSMILVLTLGSRAELYQIQTIRKKYGSGSFDHDMIHEGMLVIHEHSKAIVDATFSPEGSALATASLDGSVKFFQVYMHEKVSPRCLHDWVPHGGKPMSSIFFLDNHKNHNPESQFWKFVITGADNNNELKVWSCVDWTCLQTIRFSKDTSIVLKAGLDLTANYLLLSDIHNKLLYILRIYMDPKETVAYISSASEILLTYPILSFGIVDAGLRQYTTCFGLENDDDAAAAQGNGCADDDDEIQEAILVSVYYVQPKSMQECIIKFTPPCGNDLRLSTIFPKTIDKTEIKAECPPDNLLNRYILSNHKTSVPLTLMTPEEFSAPPGSKDQQTGELEAKEESSNDALPSFRHEALISGGSSPSREVQEILSLKDNTTSISLEDLMNSHQTKCTYYEGANVSQLVDIENNSKDDSNINEKEVIIPQSNGWPQIPILPEVPKSTEKNANLEFSNVEEFIGKPIEHSLPSKSVQRLEMTMSTILATVQEQQAHIRELRQEVALLRCNPSEASMMSLFDKALDQHEQIIKEHLTQRERKERERQENLKSTISQVVGNLLTDKLDDIVATEIKDTILPVIVNELEPLKHGIHLELAQKLSATDHLLKESISKLVQSKPIIEAISLSVAKVVSPAVITATKEVLNSHIAPRCDKALESLFVHCHNTFTHGIQGYFCELTKEIEKVKTQSKKTHDTLAHVETIHQSIKKHISTFQPELHAELHNKFTSLQDNLVKNLRETLKDNINKEFQSQKALIEGSVLSAVRSGAATPAPHPVEQCHITQAQIMQLLNSGRYNNAFQQALSAADLNLVVFTCEHVKPDIFRLQPCPLQQPVLLSLIQQLSAEMNMNAELKCLFIEEALMSIDKNNSMTKEHIPAVLNTLQKQLNAYIASYPSSQHMRTVRLLLMLSNSLLTSDK